MRVRFGVIHRQIAAAFREKYPSIVGNGHFHWRVQVIDQYGFYKPVLFGRHFGVSFAVIERLFPPIA